MRKIPLAVWLTGIVIGYYVWSDYRNEGRIKRLLAGASNETYSAADERRLVSIVTHMKNNRASVAPSDLAWAGSVENVLKSKYLRAPATITARDSRMSAMVS